MASFDLSREDLDFDRLAAYLKALAHPARLELLWRLRIPAASAEVQLKPRRRDADLAQERPMSRQSVDLHLQTLEEAGVVRREAEADGGAGKWVTDQQRVFALIEEMRSLTAIRPATGVDVDATMEADAGAAAAIRAPGPKLVLVSGPWQGRVYALAGEGPWTVGRSRSQHVALTYDPFVSAEHASVARAGDGHEVLGTPGARNPCLVNSEPLVAGGRRRLAPGDILGVGRSLLVYQPG